MFWNVMDPSDKWRIRWDYVLLLAMVYVIIFTPFYIAFQVTTGDISNPYSAVDLFVNIIFMIDILLNFRTSFPNEKGRLVRRHRAIAINYLTGWFWLDLVSSLPWELMLEADHVLGLTKAIRVRLLLSSKRLVLEGTVFSLKMMFVFCSFPQLVRLLRILKILTLVRLVRNLGKMNIKNFLQVRQRGSS